jgi:hypothetical protein
MHLILLILRLLFGLDLDGSARPLPVVARSDGRTQGHRGADWLWNWLRECADWLQIQLSRPRRDNRRARGPAGGTPRPGSGPPGTD